ncbi:MAG: hypothetical protein ABSH17_09915, partial [Syntrophobacteraceae bacterium]
MNREKKRTLAYFLMPAACLIFGISTLAMLSGFEPFYSEYYSFAWWSYIIFIESLLYCRGAKSLLFENPGKFLLLLPMSITVWLVFEALNFRLSDWHYLNIPSDTVFRWTGYAVAYSTVLPGIFSTTALLEFMGVLKNSKAAPFGNLLRLHSIQEEKTDEDSGSFRSEKEGFFAQARKSRDCAEAYMGTASRSVEILAVPPPKAAANPAGGSTAPPGRKRTLSGRKLYKPFILIGLLFLL